MVEMVDIFSMVEIVDIFSVVERWLTFSLR